MNDKEWFIPTSPSQTHETARANETYTIQNCPLSINAARQSFSIMLKRFGAQA